MKDLMKPIEVEELFYKVIELPSRTTKLDFNEKQELISYANKLIKYCRDIAYPMNQLNPDFDYPEAYKDDFFGYWLTRQQKYNDAVFVIQAIEKTEQEVPTEKPEQEVPFPEMFKNPEIFNKIIERLEVDYQDENDRTLKFGDTDNDLPALFLLLTDQEFKLHFLEPKYKKEQITKAMNTYFNKKVNKQRFEPAKIRNEKKYQKLLKHLKPVLKGK